MATQVGTVIDGKYEILKQIGKGGMSTVYLAMDKRLNKQWAVKEIRKSSSGKNEEIVINSLLAEANLMKRLDHPTLPRIVDIIDNGSTLYIIMDYIEGESLDKILKEYGPQPEEVVIDWAMQICDAFSYLHSQNPKIIYRDMKPANIMLKPEGNIKIIDFGIAREYKEQNLQDTTVLGTRGYASPEHYGSRQTDERSDIFTLGMTMHHLLTGIDPRPADYMYAPVRQWNPALSEGIEAIIDKCTQLNPEDRYQNCAELMYDLQHPDQVGSAAKKRKKNRLLSFVLTASLAVVFAIVGVAGLILNGAEKKNDYTTNINNGNYYAAIKIDPDSYDMENKENNAYYLFLKSLTKGDYAINDSELSQIKNANKLATENLGADSIEFADFNFNIAMNLLSAYKGNATTGRGVAISQVAKEAQTYIQNVTGVKSYQYYDLAESMNKVLETVTNAGIGLSEKDCEALVASINDSIDKINQTDTLNEWQITSWYLTVANSIQELTEGQLLKGKKSDFIAILEKIPTKNIQQEDVHSEVDNNNYMISSVVSTAKTAVQLSTGLS